MCVRVFFMIDINVTSQESFKRLWHRPFRSSSSQRLAVKLSNSGLLPSFRQFAQRSACELHNLRTCLAEFAAVAWTLLAYCLNIILVETFQSIFSQTSFCGQTKISCPHSCPDCALSPGPRVHSGHLEAEVPRAAVLALALRPGAHPRPVGLAILPATTVRPSVVKVKPAAVHPLGLGHSGPRGGSAGGRGHGGHCHLAVGQGGQTLPLLLLHLHVQRD